MQAATHENAAPLDSLDSIPKLRQDVNPFQSDYVPNDPSDPMPTVSELFSQIESLQKHRREFQKQRQYFEHQRTTLQSQIQNLLDSQRDLAEAKSHLESHLEIVSNEKLELESSVQSMTRVSKQLSSQVGSLKSRVDSLLDLRDTLETEKSRLESQVETLIGHRFALQAEKEDLHNHLTVSRTKNQSLSSQLTFRTYAFFIFAICLCIFFVQAVAVGSSYQNSRVEEGSKHEFQHITDSSDARSNFLDPSIKAGVFLFVGQSNMAGTQNVPEEEDKKTNPHIKKMTKRGNKIKIASPSMHEHGALSPDLPFCKYLQPLLGSDVDLIAVNAAEMGSSIQRWLPEKKFFTNAVKKAKTAMEMTGVKTLSGILWHQGESNSNYEDVLKHHNTSRDCSKSICGPYNYGRFLMEVLDGFRKEFGQNVPIVLGEVPPFIMENEVYRTDLRGVAFVNGQLRTVARENDFCLVSTWDLQNVEHGNLHFSVESVRKLGRRYADCWLKTVRK